MLAAAGALAVGGGGRCFPGGGRRRFRRHPHRSCRPTPCTQQRTCRAGWQKQLRAWPRRGGGAPYPPEHLLCCLVISSLNSVGFCSVSADSPSCLCLLCAVSELQCNGGRESQKELGEGAIPAAAWRQGGHSPLQLDSGETTLLIPQRIHPLITTHNGKLRRPAGLCGCRAEG